MVLNLCGGASGSVLDQDQSSVAAPVHLAPSEPGPSEVEIVDYHWT